MENKNIVDKRGKPSQKIAKLAKNKKVQIFAVVLVIFVFVLTYISLTSGDKDKQVTLSDGNMLTEQIQSILTSIKGVGDVKVLIVYNGGEQLEIASKVDKRVDRVEDDGRITEVVEETTTPILTDDDKPLVIGTKRADIDGVLVVAEGGESQGVRVAVMQALSTLLKIEYNSIKVFDME